MLPLLSFLLGSAIASLFFWLVLARRAEGAALARPAHVPEPPLPAGIAVPLGSQQVWTVPDVAAQRICLVALAAELQARGPALIAPAPADRAALIEALRSAPLAFLPSRDRPTCRDLAAAARILEPAGPVTVLVQGAEGLENPARDEPAHAVLEELLRSCDQALVVVAREGEPLPRPADLRLTWTGDALGFGDGEPVIVRSETGGRFLSPAE